MKLNSGSKKNSKEMTYGVLAVKHKHTSSGLSRDELTLCNHIWSTSKTSSRMQCIIYFPTISPLSQSSIFYFEEQFPRGCFSISRQVKYQSKYEYWSRKRGKESDKLLFASSSFEPYRNFFKDLCTRNSMNVDELSSKWEVNLFPTPMEDR
jgi:hypothetical protein